MTHLCTVLLLFGLTACGEKDCADLPLSRVTPAETTIAVGQAVTPRYQAGGHCLSDVPTEADYRNVVTQWATKDAEVVALDSLTGTVTGRASGDARLWPTVNPYMFLLLHVR
jgi:hypothetical protein